MTNQTEEIDISEINQVEFDKTYISSSEIVKELKVERSAIVYARSTGILPKPIKIKGTRAFLWHRVTVTPYLNAWKMGLDRKRKNH